MLQAFHTRRSWIRPRKRGTHLQMLTGSKLIVITWGHVPAARRSRRRCANILWFIILTLCRAANGETGFAPLACGWRHSARRQNARNLCVRPTIYASDELNRPWRFLCFMIFRVSSVWLACVARALWLISLLLSLAVLWGGRDRVCGPLARSIPNNYISADHYYMVGLVAYSCAPKWSGLIECLRARGECVERVAALIKIIMSVSQICQYGAYFGFRTCNNLTRRKYYYIFTI